MKNIIFLTVLSVCTTGLEAEVSISNIFGDHMVVQCEKPVRIWGWGDPAEKVTVSFAGQTKTTISDDNGNWLIKLDPVEVSFQGKEIIIEGKKNKVTVNPTEKVSQDRRQNEPPIGITVVQ